MSYKIRMKMPASLTRLCAVALSCSLTAALTIAEINGNKYLSPYQNQNVNNVTGLVTAKGPDGFWLRSTTPDDDSRTSKSLYVFSSTVGRNLTTGDIISLDGRITEYRSSAAYIYLTELTRPANVKVLSRNNTVQPVVLGGASTSPPTEQFTSLDNGNVYGVPNNASQISRVNPILEPSKYGLDFWESLSGELVTVQRPTAISKPNQYGDTWVVGSWKAIGRNSRGGLTMTANDSNPEAILIGDPLDGTDNPNGTRLGDSLSDITGVVTQGFGFYRILPVTKLNILTSPKPALPPPTSLRSLGVCAGVTVGSYNVENLAPNSTHLPAIASHIVNYLRTPDVLFLQEIQDNNGPTNDNVVSANTTLETLIDAIAAISTTTYAYADIDPVSNQDGGQPGGNIRVAYLYNPRVVRLRSNTPNGTVVAGTSTSANQVLPGSGPLPQLTGPTLKYNPGRIDPANVAWKSSRKPLAALFETVLDRRPFFTVNVHFTSKGGSSSIEGDARPPVNGGIDQRTAQANVTGSFIRQILTLDPEAAVVTSGDFNEFTFVEPLKTFTAVSSLQDLDVAAGIPVQERYTYLFDMNCQELDHVFVSPKVARRLPLFEHVHVNTWATYADQISDHDPSVARLNVC